MSRPKGKLEREGKNQKTKKTKEGRNYKYSLKVTAGVPGVRVPRSL